MDEMEHLDHFDHLEYVVDRNGVLTFVSDGWDEFARANDGHVRVLAADVVGRPLLDFIDGPTLKHLWAIVLDHVASTGRPVHLPFRCDGPGLIRMMDMFVEPAPDGGLRLVSTVVQTTARPHASIIDVNAPRNHDRMLWMCSWCKRLQAQDRWINVDEAAREFGLLEGNDVPEITHGLCPTCEREIVAELEKTARAGGEVSAACVDRGGLDLV
ncbi:MAG: hypothetical protein ACM36C_07775 [Acidobacteriota bacterium]